LFYTRHICQVLAKEQSPSSEANNHSASKEILHLFAAEPKGSLPRSDEPTT